MTVRSIAWISMVLVFVNLAFSSAAWTGEKVEKVRKEQIPGTYKHMPGEKEAFRLKEDGSGTLTGGVRHTNKWPCQWLFNEHYQMLVVNIKPFRRQYKVKLVDGKVELYEGREVFRQGVNLNALLESPLDRAVRVGDLSVPEEKPAPGLLERAIKERESRFKDRRPKKDKP